MLIESDNSVIIIKDISFKSFPAFKKCLVSHNISAARYKEQYEEEMNEGVWRIFVFKGTREHPPHISFYRPEKSEIRAFSEINVGIDWLMNKVKEDDALLAEFFILRMHGFKD